MEQVYITVERAKALRYNKEAVELLERICKCKLDVAADGAVGISAEDAYSEFNAKNVVFAFGRGFELKTAELLLSDDYYFSTIDIGQLLGSEKRVHRVKSRIIGNNGRAKLYIEQVSGVKMSIYGDTISFIGSTLQINEAQVAVNTLLEGGTHKLAYLRMEAAHRKNKAAQKGLPLL